MSNREIEILFENLRKSQLMIPISHPGMEILEESVSRRKWLAGLAAMGLIGGATFDSLKGIYDKDKEDPVKIEKSELEKYKDEIKRRGLKNYHSRNVALQNSPANDIGKIKDGWMKGVYNAKIPMAKLIEKYKEALYQLSPTMIYIHPGALDPDQVLPTSGLTASQMKDYYYRKDILNIHNTLYNTHAWAYNPPFDNSPYLYNSDGQAYLPPAWSVAYDVWQMKIYEFLDDVAENAYVERDGKYVPISDEAVKKVLKNYHIGTKSERIYILKEFELSQGDDFKISDYLQDKARRLHSQQSDTGIQEAKKRRKICIKISNS